MKRVFFFIPLIVLSFTFSGCDKGEGFNVFTIEDDIALGMETKEHILANPAEYPILRESEHSAAYSYLKAIRNDILNSGAVKHANDFPWEIYIVKDDEVLNAFCAPGGYIYVYTGLIKALDQKSALAGIMGHEIAHADRRHMTNQLTKQYGMQTLLDILLGENRGMLSEIATGLVSLKFSRSDETDADKHSVKYLCPTHYHSDGAALFFEKLLAMGASNPPQILSTHPSPDNRVESIKNEAQELGCTSTITNQEDKDGYLTFKNSL